MKFTCKDPYDWVNLRIQVKDLQNLDQALRYEEARAWDAGCLTNDESERMDETILAMEMARVSERVSGLIREHWDPNH